MKQTRSIRLFFILTAIGLLVFFWLGFRFGRQIQKSEDHIQLQQTQNEDVDTKDTGADRDLTAAETMQEKSAAGNIQESSQLKAAPDDAEEEKESEIPKFYLKESGDYLVVYVSATDQVYFETDIPLKDLPADLHEDVKEGIDFYNLENLYSFLENYSS